MIFPRYPVPAPEAVEDLERLKWFCWHGNVDQAAGGRRTPGSRPRARARCGRNARPASRRDRPAATGSVSGMTDADRLAHGQQDGRVHDSLQGMPGCLAPPAGRPARPSQATCPAVRRIRPRRTWTITMMRAYGRASQPRWTAHPSALVAGWAVDLQVTWARR